MRVQAGAGGHRQDCAASSPAAQLSPLPHRQTTGTQRGKLAAILASTSCHPMATSTLALPVTPDAHGQAAPVRAAGAGTQGAALVPGDTAGECGRQPWQLSEELGFNIHGSAGGEAFDLVRFAILLELNSHLPADTCHITATGSLEHRGGRAPADTPSTPSTTGTGWARGQNPAASWVPIPGAFLPSHPADANGALVPCSPPTAHVIPLPHSPCGANGFLQQFPCVAAAVINCMSAAISDPSAVPCHVPPPWADSTQTSPSPRISCDGYPTAGQHPLCTTPHDVGARPPRGSVQALVSPRTQHSSPLWVADGYSALGAPLGAGGACPEWAGVRQGEQGHAAHPAPVSPSLRPLPETVIEIGCGRRARAACRAPRWAAQPCHTSCRHHSLPSPPAPARASISAAPSTTSPTPCPSTAFPRG